MAGNLGESALRLGLWLDDLKIGLREGLKHAARWQADAVGIDGFSKEISPRSLSTTGRQELARLIRNADLRLAVLKADVGGRRLSDPATVDVTISKIKEAFELARDLGAVRLLVPLGHIPENDESSKPRLETSSASIFALPAPGRKFELAPTTNLAALDEAARAIGQLGSNSGIRPVVLSSAEPVERLANFLDRNDAGNLIEIDLNPGAWTAKGEDATKALFSLGTRVGIATAIDHYKGGAEAPFGQGDVPWPELIVSLSSLSRPEPLTLLAGCQREGDRVQALSEALAGLKKIRLNPMG